MPMPDVDSLATLNDLVTAGDAREDLRHVAGSH
jgi:hypothetical protein